MSPAKEFLFSHYGWCALAIAVAATLLSVVGIIRPVAKIVRYFDFGQFIEAGRAGVERAVDAEPTT